MHAYANHSYRHAVPHSIIPVRMILYQVMTQFGIDMQYDHQQQHDNHHWHHRNHLLSGDHGRHGIIHGLDRFVVYYLLHDLLGF